MQSILERIRSRTSSRNSSGSNSSHAIPPPAGDEPSQLPSTSRPIRQRALSSVNSSSPSPILTRSASGTPFPVSVSVPANAEARPNPALLNRHILPSATIDALLVSWSQTSPQQPSSAPTYSYPYPYPSSSSDTSSFASANAPSTQPGGLSPPQNRRRHSAGPGSLASSISSANRTALASTPGGPPIQRTMEDPISRQMPRSSMSTSVSASASTSARVAARQAVTPIQEMSVAPTPAGSRPRTPAHTPRSSHNPEISWSSTRPLLSRIADDWSTFGRSRGHALVSSPEPMPSMSPMPSPGLGGYVQGHEHGSGHGSGPPSSWQVPPSRSSTGPTTTTHSGSGSGSGHRELRSKDSGGSGRKHTLSRSNSGRSRGSTRGSRPGTGHGTSRTRSASRAGTGSEGPSRRSSMKENSPRTSPLMGNGTRASSRSNTGSRAGSGPGSGQSRSARAGLYALGAALNPSKIFGSRPGSAVPSVPSVPSAHGSPRLELESPKFEWMTDSPRFATPPTSPGSVHFPLDEDDVHEREHGSRGFAGGGAPWVLPLPLQPSQPRSNVQPYAHSPDTFDIPSFVPSHDFPTFDLPHDPHPVPTASSSPSHTLSRSPSHTPRPEFSFTFPRSNAHSRTSSATPRPSVLSSFAPTPADVVINAPDATTALAPSFFPYPEISIHHDGTLPHSSPPFHNLHLLPTRGSLVSDGRPSPSFVEDVNTGVDAPADHSPPCPPSLHPSPSAFASSSPISSASAPGIASYSHPPESTWNSSGAIATPGTESTPVDLPHLHSHLPPPAPSHATASTTTRTIPPQPEMAQTTRTTMLSVPPSSPGSPSPAPRHRPPRDASSSSTAALLPSPASSSVKQTRPRAGRQHTFPRAQPITPQASSSSGSGSARGSTSGRVAGPSTPKTPTPRPSAMKGSSARRAAMVRASSDQPQSPDMRERVESRSSIGKRKVEDRDEDTAGESVEVTPPDQRGSIRATRFAAEDSRGQRVSDASHVSHYHKRPRTSEPLPAMPSSPHSPTPRRAYDSTFSSDDSPPRSRTGTPRSITRGSVVPHTPVRSGSADPQSITPKTASTGSEPFTPRQAHSRTGTTGTTRSERRTSILTNASIPVSAIVSPHAPSLSTRGAGGWYHMRDPQRPTTTPTSWTPTLSSKVDGQRVGGSPVHCWLFLVGFILFPAWWIASVLGVPNTRTLNEEGEKGQRVVVDDPQIERDAKTWRTRCRVMAGVSLVTYIPFVVLVAWFATR